jgi:tRNA nucleotidyltransferase (CCA-adding enzyme)
MKVVLTHEQADFDALASLLAASILRDGAIPVLPHRLNRNVRAFLNLYGSVLPFVDLEDLPKEEIDMVFLVDTQSMVTLRGISPTARVQVIDHHNPRPGLLTEWEMIAGKVGATTTILAEELIQRGEVIGPISASLLLLGIYEDTGSFQYSSTTPRDIRAGAYLLENGASLKLVVDFLNPPLSDTQRDVYDHLLASARSNRIQGFNIVIAIADAPSLVDEISSVAHKLRDLLDQDALFLVVATRDGIRIVARSSSDHIDVGTVMTRFGGGGHERAAAALIPTATSTNQEDHANLLESTCMELTETLEKHIRPALTVNRVMSRRPMTLRLDTPVDEAARLMQRYGYEGFPVVDGAAVAGLLTRRNVDRAIAHKLNLTAAEIMETGSVWVQPGDSLNTLQKVMAETGWGQVPVFDPEKNKIVGIVTRTDLLRILTSEGKPAERRRNLGKELDAYLPGATISLLKLIAAKGAELGFPVYLVGGIVRDLLLKRKGADLDIVVEGDGIRLAKSLVEEYGGRQVSHSRFGTAKWFIRDIHDHLLGLPGFSHNELEQGLPERVDLISSRTEFYEYPSALPTVERGSIKLDLFRRDFTINTLALRLDGSHYGELHDFWGGLDDLQNGIIRVLHPLSFIDDPTRLLRAVRFEQRFEFRIEDRTLGLIQKAVPLLGQISGQRARHELDLFFEEARHAEIIERASSLGLLEAIHSGLVLSPERLENIRITWNLKAEKEWELSDMLFSLPCRTALIYLTWLSRLEEHEGISASSRLRLTAEFTNSLRQVYRGRRIIEKLCRQRPSHIAAHLEKIPRAALFLLYSEARETCQRELIWKFLTTWRKIKPVTDGEDLQKLGIPAGPLYKNILASLRSAWLDGEVSSDEQEREYLHKLLAQLPPTDHP